MIDLFSDIAEGDIIALRYEGLWFSVEVEKVQDRFIHAEGMKFSRASGRQAGVVINPAYIMRMNSEIQDLIDKRHLVAELSAEDWAQFTANDLRDIHMTVEYIKERKHG